MKRGVVMSEKKKIHVANEAPRCAETDRREEWVKPEMRGFRMSDAELNPTNSGVDSSFLS